MLIRWLSRIISLVYLALFECTSVWLDILSYIFYTENRWRKARKVCWFISVVAFYLDHTGLFYPMVRMTYVKCRSWSTTIVCWCTQKSRIQKVLPHLFHKLLNDCNRGTTTVTSTCNRYTTTIKCIHVHVHVAGLCCLWFCRNACSLIYYGLLFYLPTLGGNVYLGLVLSGLVEVRWRTCRFVECAHIELVIQLAGRWQHYMCMNCFSCRRFYFHSLQWIQSWGGSLT